MAAIEIKDAPKIHTGCAYCASADIKFTRLHDEEPTTVVMVIECGSCRREDWIHVNRSKFAHILPFVVHHLIPEYFGY